MNLSWAEKIRDKFDRDPFGERGKRDKAFAILNRLDAIVVIDRFFYLLTKVLAVSSCSEDRSFRLEGKPMSHKIVAK